MNISDFLAEIPARYELFASLLIISCKIITIFIRPPASTSRWAPVYQIVSAIALNIGWAANRLQVGRTGIMVPRAQAVPAREAITGAGVPLTSRKN